MKTQNIPWLVIFLLIFAATLRVDFVFYIAYVLGGIYFFVRWYIPRTLSKLKITREFAPNAFLGEKVPVRITVENPTRLPLPWLRVEEMTPLQLRSGTAIDHAITLNARETSEINYTVRGMKRGYYRIGPMRFEAGDVFGFREDKGTFPEQYLTVYPQIVPITRLRLPSRLPFGTIASKQRLYEDPARPIGVRKFRSGDGLRQINWKVSGRYAGSPGGGLMVKTLEPAISLETMIVLDMNRSAYTLRGIYDTMEWSVTAAASLAAHLVNQRQSVGLATNGYDPLHDSSRTFDEATGRLLTVTENTRGWSRPKNIIRPHAGRRHLMKILEVLARIDLQTIDPVDEFIPEAALNLAWGTTILFITPDSSIDVTNALHRLVRSGYNPILLVTERHSDFPEVRERARRLGFRAFELITEPDLAINH